MPTASITREAIQSRAEVRKYVAKLPTATRKRFNELADTIRKTVPGSVEGISYGIPSIRLNGRIVVWYAGWAKHLSMYPLTAEDREFAAERGYKTSKGTVQFSLDKPLPVSLVKRLVRSRLRALKAKKATKA